MAVVSMPRSSLIAGNASAFREHGLRFYQDCERLGPLVRARFFHLRVYVVTGPELVETVLVRKPGSFQKPRLLKHLRLVFGDGLLTADGESWKYRRRLIQPTLHKRRNLAYARIFERNIARMLAGWSAGARNVHPDLIELCITNMTSSLFGVEDAVLNRRIARLASCCHELATEMETIRFPIYALAPQIAEMRFRAQVRRLEAGIVDRVASLRTTQCPHQGREVEDVYSRLVGSNDHDGCPMGRTGIRDEMFTMFLAGHETAAAAVSWALQLLARHPERLERLAREIHDVCGDEAPSFEHLDSLPYLDNVLTETYRLYPPTHRMGRTVIEPTTLDDVVLVPGDEIVLPQWAVHRSPTYYDEPDEFRPERWTVDFIARLPRFAFFPFSGGPRVCAGQDFVRIEDALILASIVQRFDFDQVGPEIQPFEGLTLLPKGGRMVLSLRKRERTKPPLRFGAESGAADPPSSQPSRADVA
jgi:cytochrome P450